MTETAEEVLGRQQEQYKEAVTTAAENGTVATLVPEAEVVEPTTTTAYNPSIYHGSKHTFTAKERQKFYLVREGKKHFIAAETAERYKYLLEITDIFRKFLYSKSEKDPRFAEVLNILQSEKAAERRQAENRRQRKTEKEEDEELLKEQDESDEDEKSFEFTDSPAYVNGQMRSYQVQGLNWLISLDANHLSGILADEMGLGKTLQTISFLGYLRYIKGVPGPHLVIVPKSTLDNWKREFARWTPEVNTVILTGNQDERNEIIKERIMPCDFDVVISSYEIVIREKATLRKFDWQYIVVDEAHRLKNEDSLLSQIIRMFHSKNRLLLTGTPLQNNLHELWALLNFLLPDIFSDSETFDEWFNGGGNEEQQGEAADQDLVVRQLHKVLQPFLLRRIKADVERSLLPKKELNVYVGMSDMQKKWYQKILEKDIDAVNGANGKKESKTRLLNIAMQLRKCCNHPYLFDGAEPGPPYTTDEHLVYNAGKMLVLDRLLKRLRQQGSRVLIFSQMSRMLDILEDYSVFRGWGYCRIDGQTDHADRIKAIDEYNEPGSDKFLFLLTTRAGGLGINLTSADVVVLYDSDWNPQADLQAMDRAHRIGQKKQVKVFRLVTENAIEEKILERASQKLRLDQLVIQQGRQVMSQEHKGNSKDELLTMIQHGAATVLGTYGQNSEVKQELSDDEIDRILEESEKKTHTLKSKFATLGLDDLQNFTSGSESVYEWDGKNFRKKEPATVDSSGLGIGVFSWIGPSKRERKSNYSVDQYYRDVLNTRGAGNKVQPEHRDIRQPKHLNLYDHQFYPLQLGVLHDLEMNHYRKLVKQRAELAKGSKDTLKIRELDQQLDQAEIDRSRALTEEEESWKQDLLKEGFGDFARRDFFQFVGASARYGRNSIDEIASELPEKTVEEVREYAVAFWKNFREIDGYERHIGHIEQGEDRIRKIIIQKEMLRRKVSQYDYPLEDLTFRYPPHSARGKKTFNDDEDRFLIVQLYRIGLDNPDIYELIRQSIRNSSMFRFDYFFNSRTATELNRRCITLLTSLQKEFEYELPEWYERKREGSVIPEKRSKKSRR
ncbi:DEKNAAC103044 [Brettanomyces naardenensis]|uniref:DEKNAAC103044 n=1 Tax=Brettanomyces naardenensis TaxID=13370 RepID=A0A448YMD4_BRENA|nr:DEKNAAC103044 [Brettanomyces naardenensis]